MTLAAGSYEIVINAVGNDGREFTHTETILIGNPSLGLITHNVTLNDITPFVVISGAPVVVNLGLITHNVTLNDITPFVVISGAPVVVNLGLITHSVTLNNMTPALVGPVVVNLGLITHSVALNNVAPFVAGPVIVNLGLITHSVTLGNVAALVRAAETDLEYELQTSIYGALSSALAVTVYDDPPQGASAFPYVTIGEAIHADFSSDAQLGFDVSLTVHVWSRHAGRAEIKQIQGAIYRALNRAIFNVNGYNLITCDFVDSQSFIDADGKTRHGTQTFRLLLNEAQYV